MTTVAAELKRALDELDLLSGIITSQLNKEDVDFERLLIGYLDARRSLAKHFSEVSQKALLRGDTLIEQTRRSIEERMRTRFHGRVPDSYLAVRGYKAVHPVLLQYLAQHVGDPVPGAKLRVLIGDQVHTERRVRDLRDLGFDVVWKKVSDDNQYVLKSVQPDFDEAAAVQLRHNIKNDKKLSSQQRSKLLSVLGG